VKNDRVVKLLEKIAERKAVERDAVFAVLAEHGYFTETRI